MYMKNTFLLLSWLILLPSGILANPIKGMLERIDKGASDKFVVELHKSPNDFFELDQKGDKVSLPCRLSGLTRKSRSGFCVVRLRTCSMLPCLPFPAFP